MKDQIEKIKNALDILDKFINGVSGERSASFGFDQTVITEARQALYDIIQMQPIYNMEVKSNSILIWKYDHRESYSADWFTQQQGAIEYFLKNAGIKNVALIFVPYDQQLINVIHEKSSQEDTEHH